MEELAAELGWIENPLSPGPLWPDSNETVHTDPEDFFWV